MRLLLLLLFLSLIATITALPNFKDSTQDLKEKPIEKPISLSDVAEAGDIHSNAGDRKSRFFFGGWGYRPWGWGWGGRWGGYRVYKGYGGYSGWGWGWG